MRVYAILLAALAAAVSATGSARAACTSRLYRQFDFFVGHWRVYDRDGRFVGTDVVEKRLKNCVVSERFTNADGSVGIGLSGIQAGRWYQDFMGDDGLLVTLRGAPRPGAAMVLEGEDFPKGRHRLDRGVWTVRGNVVEELWTASTDEGKTWHTVFDGFFHRVTPGHAG